MERSYHGCRQGSDATRRQRQVVPQSVIVRSLFTRWNTTLERIRDKKFVDFLAANISQVFNDGG